jgi:hypothetical protein
LNDKNILARSHAGMRLIALATLYNQGDFPRIRAYLREHYTPEALEVSSPALRLAEMREQMRTLGKVKVRQVVAHDKHHVVVLLETQSSGLLLEDISVEVDYPHRVIAHTRQQVG